MSRRQGGTYREPGAGGALPAMDRAEVNTASEIPGAAQYRTEQFPGLTFIFAIASAGSDGSSSGWY